MWEGSGGTQTPGPAARLDARSRQWPTSQLPNQPNQPINRPTDTPTAPRTRCPNMSIMDARRFLPTPDALDSPPHSELARERDASDCKNIKMNKVKARGAHWC